MVQKVAVNLVSNVKDLERKTKHSERYESFYTDTDKETAYGRASGKSFVCARGLHVTACVIAYVFGCIYVDRGLCSSLLFAPPSVMAQVHSKPLLDVCLRGEKVPLSLSELWS